MTEPPIRVLITGSREFTDRAIVAAALTAVARKHPGRHLIVAHGAARGAYSLAAAIAADYPNHLTAEAHPVTDWRRPDWSTDRAAGHRRIQRIVDAGAEVCLAFLHAGAQNRGTRGCMQKAAAAGIPVREHWQTVDEVDPTFL